jgi:hypothetical protein
MTKEKEKENEDENDEYLILSTITHIQNMLELTHDKIIVHKSIDSATRARVNGKIE